MSFPAFPATLRRAALTALLSLGSLTLAHAQGPGNTGPALPGTGPAAVPLDGGTSLLLAAGVGLGLRRLRRGRRASA